LNHLVQPHSRSVTGTGWGRRVRLLLRHKFRNIAAAVRRRRLGRIENGGGVRNGAWGLVALKVQWPHGPHNLPPPPLGPIVDLNKRVNGLWLLGTPSHEEERHPEKPHATAHLLDLEGFWLVTLKRVHFYVGDVDYGAFMTLFFHRLM